MRSFRDGALADREFDDQGIASSSDSTGTASTTVEPPPEEYFVQQIQAMRFQQFSFRENEPFLSFPNFGRFSSDETTVFVALSRILSETGATPNLSRSAERYALLDKPAVASTTTVFC
jgi:hypothetical protein